MAIEIRMPEVLAGATEGVISHWSIKEGDEVAVRDVLAEIETEKASVEYQAEDAGTVARLLQSAGQTVQVGEPIAIFAAEGDTDADIEKALADAGATSREPVADTPVAVTEPAAAPGAAVEIVDVATVPVCAAGERVLASPIVRKLAREAGIDLAQIPGSGPRGRIVRKDFDAYRASASAAAPVTAPAPARNSAGFTEVPHSSMRRASAPPD